MKGFENHGRHRVISRGARRGVNPRKAAITSLVASVVAIALVGLGSFAAVAVALRSWQWTRESVAERGLARAALILSGLSLVVIALLILAFMTDNEGAGGPGPSEVPYVLTVAAIAAGVGVVVWLAAPAFVRFLRWVYGTPRGIPSN
jgi:hypothetical protein